MKSLRWAGLLLWASVCAQAAPPVDADITRLRELSASFDNDYDEKPWSEVELQLPPFPEKTDLIPFRVGYITDTRFFVDGKSISVGSDGVVRFTVVVISPEGAQNISYEGLRCATYERRYYASGRSDKTWSKARSNKWVLLRGNSNDFRIELFFNNFCVSGIAASNAEAARDLLRRGGVPPPR